MIGAAFRTLFCATLLATLLVNIMFLLATKDKPPDAGAPRPQRRLVLRSNDARDYEDASSQLTSPLRPPPEIVTWRSDSAPGAGGEKTNKSRPRASGWLARESALTTATGERREPAIKRAPPRRIKIRAKSSKSHVRISVDDNVIYESRAHADPRAPPAAERDSSADGAQSDGRGIHVLVLSQFDARVMSRRVFDTYAANQDEELGRHLRLVSDGRILVLAVQDEASFRMAPGSPARLLLARLGSRLIGSLRWRDMWALVVRKHTLLDTELQLGESAARRSELHAASVNCAEAIARSARFSDWAEPVEIEAELELLEPSCPAPPCGCPWSRRRSAEDARRADFCARVEGYGRVCDCDSPAPISFRPAAIERSQLGAVPIVVMASNRPHYLFRMLSSLLAADGVDPKQVVVFIDGFYEEPLEVCRLLNLRAVQQRPLGRRSARISHHYRSSLAATFALFPASEFAIIFEEDLDVARDALVYFNRTLGVLDSDPTLYCISAWNDQGYEHSTADAGLVYRVETMPGLGWMLSRRLYREELESQWPPASQPHDWDMWIRTSTVRKGRECLIPDVSRTFHFGSSGTNINSYFQRQYFSKHAFELNPSRRLAASIDPNQLKSDAYERLIERLVADAEIVTSNQTNATDFLCSLASSDSMNAIDVGLSAKSGHRERSGTGTRSHNVIFIKMIDSRDFKNWLKLAKCWRIWDLDARGQHKSMWRLHLNGQPTLVIGAPASPYSRFKPKELTPFDL